MTERMMTTITLPEGVRMPSLVGCGDAWLKICQDALSARIAIQGDEIRISGTDPEREMAVTVMSALISELEHGVELEEKAVRRILAQARQADLSPKALKDDVVLAHKGRAIRPKTVGQKTYVDALRSSTITFCIGPAGTGKTYLAMAYAVAALDRREVSRLILSRPIVEAGESLGFLPGTLTEKVDPYIRPLYDALFQMMDPERATSLIDRGVIEIVPLAFMRGRTLSDSFIILDEAQNATPEQMKMFLTRLGDSSQMVITGDMSQSDLPKGSVGLSEALQVLQGIDDISQVRLEGKDVVRSSLVSQIIEAYERKVKGER
ncbi:MAG: PhoH family protein [Eggerthellaceae bacterium]|nr:PhoH family protein [Eggerthellaceae bacterium]